MAELLGIQFSSNMQEIAEKVFEYQLLQDEELREGLSDIAKKRMFDDILININFLETALKLRDESVFPEYARWCYTLLASRMTYLSREQVTGQLIHHFELLKKALVPLYSQEEGTFIKHQVDQAVAAVRQCGQEDFVYRDARQQNYEKEAEYYLKCLLDGDAGKTIQYLMTLEKTGMDIPEIYVDVVQEALHRVGDLWLHDKINVAKELCCTSMNQMAQAQFYGKIFATPRRNRTILVACVGQEHHEMGARTISDILSYGGYSCIYLGAAVSWESLCQAMDSHRPQMICLSSTMPQTLVDCQWMIPRIRAHAPTVKIAVGGRAFQWTDEIWKTWDIDIYTKDAKELLEWAYANIG